MVRHYLTCLDLTCLVSMLCGMVSCPQFIDKVSWRLGRYMAAIRDEAAEDTIRVPKRSFRRNYNVDQAALKQLFAEYDRDGSGAIGIAELESILVRGVAYTHLR